MAIGGKSVALHEIRPSGFIDLIGGRIEGWCIDHSEVTPPRVSLHLNGRRVALISPDIRRDDIERRFKVSAPTGFKFDLLKLHPRVILDAVLSPAPEFALEMTLHSDASFALPTDKDKLIAREVFVDAHHALQENARSAPNNELDASLDLVSNNMIKGWIVNLTAEGVRPTEICIYHDLVYIDSIAVVEPRPDFARMLGLPTNCGFSYSLEKVRFLWPSSEPRVEDLEFRVPELNYELSHVASAAPSVRSKIATSTTTALSRFGTQSNVKALGEYTPVFFSRRQDLESVLVLYAIHNRGRTLTENQRVTISSLKALGCSVMVINSYPDNHHVLRSELERYSDGLVSKSNYGRDFGSWISFALKEFELVRSRALTIFVNDSILGPFKNLRYVLDSLNASDADIWALTDSYQRCYHLQTSFFSIRQTAWENEDLCDYFRSYSFPDDKQDVIERGELGFSRAIVTAGLKTGILAPYRLVAEEWLHRYGREINEIDKLPEATHPFVRLEAGHLLRSNGYVDHARIWYSNVAADLRMQIPRNPQHTFWNILLDSFQYPFLKRELIAVNPDQVCNLHLIWDLVASAEHEYLERVITEALYDAGRGPPIKFAKVL